MGDVVDLERHRRRRQHGLPRGRAPVPASDRRDSDAVAPVPSARDSDSETDGRDEA